MSIPMRFRALALALLLAPLGGCFVFDEIDSAGQPAGKTAAADAQRPAQAGANAAARPSWWEKASSLDPAGRDASVVSCRLPGGVQYMREADCLTRGGRPSRG